MVSNIPTVFFDANTIIKAGRPPGGPLFKRLVDLVKSEKIKVLATDLSQMEVAKKHALNDYGIIKEVGRSHFRKVVKGLFGTDLPTISKSELLTMLYGNYFDDVTEMYNSISALVISINDIKPLEIFRDYTVEQGLFSGDCKKDQFPDAFHFARLKQFADKNGPILIVSGDNDFIAPCQGLRKISLLRSIPALFETLGLKVEEPNLDLDNFIEKNKDSVRLFFNKEVNEWGLSVRNIEGGQIDEAIVEKVTLDNFVSFGLADAGDSILVIGDSSLYASVSYSYPDWDVAIYDSEDTTPHAFDDVTGSTHVTLNVRFSMSLSVNADGSIFEIEEIMFIGEDFIWVDIEDEYGFPIGWH